MLGAGPSFADVIDVVSFHTHPQTQFDKVLAIRTEEIGGPPYPTWTAVGMMWLAGFDFELKVVAGIPASPAASSVETQA